MTMPAHAGDSRSRVSERTDFIDAGVMVKRLCLGALATLIGGVVLAWMIALETAVYLQAVDF
jgi:hypothetical protein